MAAYRSGLFEVANAAPGAASSVGIARLELLPLRGPQMSHCMSSQVAYSVWPPATARAIGSPGCSTPNRFAVACAFPRETGCTLRPVPSSRAARSAPARGPPLRASEHDGGDQQRARGRGGDQDRRARGRPVGPAVGELEHQGERIDRRAVAPMVDRRAGLRGGFPRHGGQGDERERARQQR